MNNQKTAQTKGRTFWRSVFKGMRFGSALTNRVAALLIAVGIGCGVATYGALTATPPFGNDPNTVIWLLNADLVILLLLGSLTARRIASLWAGRRKGIAGSRLHVRLVFVFSLMAAVPAIIMAIFSAYFMHFGVQSWFSERVRTAVSESQAVAEAYLEEHMQVIRADTLAMANDIDRQASLLATNSEAFDRVMETQSLFRNLAEAAVFDSSGRILARSGMTFSLAFESIPSYTLGRADDGEVEVMTGDGDDRVRALVKLNNFADAYLFVGRMVDQTVLSHVSDTRKAVKEYERLEAQRSGLQVKIMLIFGVVALLLLFTAIWFGMLFARQLILPVSTLITASERVRAGDLNVRVPEINRRDEFDILARSFNSMTGKLGEQRDELVAANRQLEERRRFTETVLAGVSSGILGVDSDGVIRLANASAEEVFGCDPGGLTGHNVNSLLPTLGAFLEQAMTKPTRITQTEIPYLSKDDSHRRTLLVRIAVDPEERQNAAAAVITFDDITALQSAQRKAAWADVARRIAHEIKNPLTPIQLSAERLKRKYMNQITEGADIFAQCTDTIIHHVGDIGRMVNEFSSFARMPEPVLKQERLEPLVRETVVLLQQAHPDIDFTIQCSPGLESEVDARQVRQAVSNIVQNALDSVQFRMERNGLARGSVDILLMQRKSGEDNVIVVTDSGAGFPAGSDVTRLTDPYVTHKERGTGLGLAIVKKIMEDHGGKLVLGAPDWVKALPDWREPEGATVLLVFPAAAIEQRRAMA